MEMMCIGFLDIKGDRQIEFGGDSMDYIERIRALREDHDITQQAIADILGTSQTMYARYERGANEMPLRHLITLCKFYDVSADYILGFTNKIEPKK